MVDLDKIQEKRINEYELKMYEKIIHRYGRLRHMCTENILRENKFKCVLKGLRFNVQGNT